MLFFETVGSRPPGEMLTAGIVDLVEPPRCGGTAGAMTRSHAALMLAQPGWTSRVLPLRPARLDPARRLHRWMQGRPQTWLALEQMFDVAGRTGRLRYAMLSPELGCSLHVARREEAALGIMPAVRAAMESGRIPAAQIEHGHNFALQAWVSSEQAAAENRH